MSYGHDIENGHDCPRCGTNYICTIEDGFCENNGLCDRCIRREVMSMSDDEREYREMMQEQYDREYS